MVAELAANAASHGRVPGRSFRLTLRFTPSSHLHIEVTDARGDLMPQVRPAPFDTDGLAPGGRGLALVAALADHWETVPCPPSGKTVRATLTHHP